MNSSKSIGVKCFLKALIGWSGLVYFFFTNNEMWGEAIGLTLFFASGQLQNAMKPPLQQVGLNSKIIPADYLLEAWRITLGLTSCIYYFYFALYLNTGLDFYVSTICLSLLWESQVVDDVINVVSSWLSRDMVASVKVCAKNVAKLNVIFCKPKSNTRDIIQDFLCVLCKLYKHLTMNFHLIYVFIITKIQAELESKKLTQSDTCLKMRRPLPMDAGKRTQDKFSQYLPCIQKEMTRNKTRSETTSHLCITRYLGINTSCGMKYVAIMAQPKYPTKDAFRNVKNLTKARAAKSCVF